MRILAVILLLLCAASPVWGQITLVKSDKLSSINYPSGSIADVSVETAADSSWVFVKLDQERAALLDQPQPCIIVFDQQGTMISLLAGLDPSHTGGVSVSPKGDILAIDRGLQPHDRTWTFFTAADSRQLGQPLPYQPLDGQKNLVWLNDSFVLTPFLGEPKAREIKCGNRQPCGNDSLNLYNVRRQVVMPIFRGTDLCGYYYTRFDNQIIYGEKVCVKEAGEWSKPEPSVSRTTVIGRLPDSY